LTAEDCAKNFPDDRTTSDGVELLRRIPPRHFHFDENLGRLRPSSAAFEDDPDGDPMSVYRRDVIESEAGDVRRVVIGHQGYAVVSLTAGQVRSKRQTVFPDPLPEESSHAKVCGPKTKATRRWFSQQDEWAIQPPKAGLTERS